MRLIPESGVERELGAIVEQGKQMVRGLRALEVEAEPPTDMGDPLIVIRATVDPAFENDPSHHAWWCWRIDQYGPIIASQFLVALYPDRTSNGR